MGSIPKITHQIWLQGWDKLPEKYQENVRLLSEMNPDFEHKRWDEESLRAECSKLGKPYVEKFDSFEHFIMKVDFGRYVVLYNYGGISIDTDMKPLKPLQNTPGLDTEEFMVSRLPFPVNMTGFLNNAIFVVRPKHPLMKEIVDAIMMSKKRLSDYATQELYIDGETGPSFINGIIKKHEKQVKILDNEYFEPCYSVDPYCEVPEKSILDHQHTMSWINPFYHYLFRFLFFIYHNIIYIILAVALIYWAYFTKSGQRIFRGIFRKR